MYVCLCHGISQQVIDRMISEGDVRSLSDLQRKCLAGTDCGSCVKSICQAIQDRKSHQK